MSQTKKFAKLIKATREEYGYTKGTGVAHAIAQKKGWRH